MSTKLDGKAIREELLDVVGVSVWLSGHEIAVKLRKEWSYVRVLVLCLEDDGCLVHRVHTDDYGRPLAQWSGTGKDVVDDYATIPEPRKRSRDAQSSKTTRQYQHSLLTAAFSNIPVSLKSPE